MYILPVINTASYNIYNNSYTIVLINACYKIPPPSAPPTSIPVTKLPKALPPLPHAFVINGGRCDCSAG